MISPMPVDRTGEPGLGLDARYRLERLSGEFTDTGQVELELSCSKQTDTDIRVRLAVRDSGIGIDAADLSRIFEPFERVEGARAPLTPGIGLGLTITRLLTQIMGGELTVTSELNQGSRFRVRLMLSEALQPLKPAPLESRVYGYKGERLTVLIADDDPVHRGLLPCRDRTAGRWRGGCAPAASTNSSSSLFPRIQWNCGGRRTPICATTMCSPSR